MKKISLLTFLMLIYHIGYSQCINNDILSNTIDTVKCNFFKDVTINVNSVDANTRLTIYQNNSNTIYKPEQTSNIFTNLVAGTYDVVLRKYCPSTSTYSDTVKKKLYLNNYFIPDQNDIYLTFTNESDCPNSLAQIEVNNNGQKQFYRYALVNNINADNNIPSNFIRPKQTSNIFGGLANNQNYYVRVYDSCNNYATKLINIYSNSSTTTITTNYSAYNTRIVGCDSMYIEFEVNSPTYPTNSIDSNIVKCWIVYPDNSVDTLSENEMIMESYYTLSKKIFNLRKLLTPAQTYNASLTYPENIGGVNGKYLTYNYRNKCGYIATYQFDLTPFNYNYFNSKFNFQNNPQLAKCDSVNYIFSNYSLSNSNIEYSVDSINWVIGNQASQSIPSFSKYFANNTSQDIYIKVCDFVKKISFNVGSQPVFDPNNVVNDILITYYNRYNCDTNSSSIIINGYNGLGRIYTNNNPLNDSFHFYVKNLNTGYEYPPIVRSFQRDYYYGDLVLDNPTLLSNLDTGTYQVRFLDSISPVCSNSSTMIFNIRNIERVFTNIISQNRNVAMCGKSNIIFDLKLSPYGTLPYVQSIQTPSGQSPITSNDLIQFIDNNNNQKYIALDVLPGTYQFVINDTTGQTVSCPGIIDTFTTTVDSVVSPSDSFWVSNDCSGNLILNTINDHVDDYAISSIGYGNIPNHQYKIKIYDESNNIIFERRNNDPQIISSYIDNYNSKITIPYNLLTSLSISGGLYRAELILMDSIVTSTGIRYADANCVKMETNFYYSNVLNLENSEFFKNCNGSSNNATIVTVAVGGSAPITYNLYLNNLNPSNFITSQTNPIFNNLNPNNTYIVTATDNCGSGANVTLSNPKDSFQINQSSPEACIGNSFKLTAPPFTNANFEWYKNNNLIIGENRNTYKINSVTALDAGVYNTNITLGNCLISSNYITIAPTLCSIPLSLDLLTHFSGKSLITSNELNWKLIGKDNLQTMVLQRSSDSKDWTNIQTYNLNNISNLNFQFLDLNPSNGKNYYRLSFKSSDKDFFSKTIILNNKLEKSFNLLLYPNPVKNKLTITAEKSGKIIVYSVDGKIIDQFNVIGNQPYDLNTTTYNDGSYYLSFSDQHSIKVTKQFVIIK